MKKLLFALAAAAAVCGCSQRSTLSDGRFVVGFDADFPPYGYKDGAEYKGFDLDLARAVCEKKGWTFVANPINWDAKDMELNSGAIDCIWNGFTMQGREDAYTWSCAAQEKAALLNIADMFAESNVPADAVFEIITWAEEESMSATRTEMMVRNVIYPDGTESDAFADIGIGEAAFIDERRVISTVLDQAVVGEFPKDTFGDRDVTRAKYSVGKVYDLANAALDA